VFFQRWTSRLPLPLTTADRDAGYWWDLTMRQVETSRTIVLDAPRHARAFFEALVADNLDLGRPESVELIFKRDPRGRKAAGTFKTAIDRHTDGVTVNVSYRHSRIKQYLKDGRALRIETVINDAYDLGLKRLLPNLDLWVPDTRSTSCDLRVLVDQPTESVPAYDPPSRLGDSCRFATQEWRLLSQGTVRTVDVVMAGVLGQHRLQLPTSEDEHPVQRLPPNRADPPLRRGVRLGRLDRCAQHLDPLGGNHRVERGGELRIPITDQEPEPVHERFRACWATHPPTGCDVTPSTWTRRVATSITNSTYSRRRRTVSTVKTSRASTPLAWARRNCRHVMADRAGAGSTPARCRMVHTVLAPILSLYPRRHSSPGMRR
jgi:hypothetical protein